MAITSELIGKLGGGGVAEIPVSATGLTGPGTNHHLATVEVSDRTLVVVGLNITSVSSNSAYQPEIYIGDTSHGKVGKGEVAFFEIVNADADIDIGVTTHSSAPLAAVDLQGHVYTAKM